MTNVEISIIVIAALIPIISLVIFLPKLKKLKSEKTVQTTSPAPVVEEQTQEEKTTVVKPAQDNNPRELFSSAYNPDDFKGYLTDKSKHTDRPTKKEFYFEGGELDDDFFDDFNFSGPRRKPPIKNEDKSISQQIQDLSPEIKAFILTGVLDKKDY